MVTLAFLLFIYTHSLTNLYDESSSFHKFCEEIRDYFGFEVDYSDLSLLLFFIFRLILLMFERVYDVYWYTQFGKNWTVGRGLSEEKDIGKISTDGLERSETNDIHWNHELKDVFKRNEF